MADENEKPAEPLKEVEVRTTFIEVFGDRLKSHTLGGFVLAWLAIHWEVTYATLLLSSDELPTYDDQNVPILNKLDYVKTLKYTWGDNYGWPLLFALVVPILAHLFDELTIKLAKQKLTNWGVRLRAEFAAEKVFTQAQMDESIKKCRVLTASNEQLENQIEKLRAFSSTAAAERERFNRDNIVLSKDLELAKNDSGRHQEAAHLAQEEIARVTPQITALSAQLSDCHTRNSEHLAHLTERQRELNRLAQSIEEASVESSRLKRLQEASEREREEVEAELQRTLADREEDLQHLARWVVVNRRDALKETIQRAIEPLSAAVIADLQEPSQERETAQKLLQLLSALPVVVGGISDSELSMLVNDAISKRRRSKE
jgi:hypothetical protein